LNDLIDDFTKSDFKLFWEDFEIFLNHIEIWGFDLRFDFQNVHENQISNNLKSYFHIATKHLKNSFKTNKIP
jgi:hypothetical protein